MQIAAFLILNGNTKISRRRMYKEMQISITHMHSHCFAHLLEPFVWCSVVVVVVIVVVRLNFLINKGRFERISL